MRLSLSIENGDKGVDLDDLMDQIKDALARNKYHYINAARIDIAETRNYNPPPEPTIHPGRAYLGGVGGAQTYRARGAYVQTQEVMRDEPVPETPPTTYPGTFHDDVIRNG